METITIHFKKSVKEKLLNFLATFSENELEVSSENFEFEKAKKELHKDYEYSKREDAEFYTVNEAREMLNKKYEK